MTSSDGQRPKHLSSSPFAPKVEATVENFEVDDRITHDLYGLGRVVNVEAHAVSVDFGERTLRIVSPYSKLHQL